MIASFPMYDRPETRHAWNALWNMVRSEAIARAETSGRASHELPSKLIWDEDGAAHWLRDDLVLSQTCSLPYRTRLHDKVTLIGAIDFGLPGCPPGHYNSVLVMRANDARQAVDNWSELTLAYNAPDSQSGWAAPYFHLASMSMSFGRGLETGAHHASAVAVANGDADIAALDAQTFAILQEFEPDLMAQLSEVARTEPTPGLPLISSVGFGLARDASSLDILSDGSAQNIRKSLGIKSFVPIPSRSYMALPIPQVPDQVFAT